MQNKNNKVEDLLKNIKELKNHQSEAAAEIKRLIEVVQIKEEQTSQLLRNTTESRSEIKKCQGECKKLTHEVKTAKEELEQKKAEVKI